MSKLKKPLTEQERRERQNAYSRKSYAKLRPHITEFDIQRIWGEVRLSFELVREELIEEPKDVHICVD